MCIRVRPTSALKNGEKILHTVPSLKVRFLSRFGLYTADPDLAPVLSGLFADSLLREHSHGFQI